MIHSPRHQITCAQFVDKAEAFALEALDELEQRACARHILRHGHHAGCREALATARGVVDSLAAAPVERDRVAPRPRHRVEQRRVAVAHRSAP